jgi:hypothetical protein
MSKGDAATTLPKTPLIGDGKTIARTRAHYVTCIPGKSERWNDRGGNGLVAKMLHNIGFSVIK